MWSTALYSTVNPVSSGKPIDYILYIINPKHILLANLLCHCSHPLTEPHYLNLPQL